MSVVFDAVELVGGPGDGEIVRLHPMTNTRFRSHGGWYVYHAATGTAHWDGV